MVAAACAALLNLSLPNISASHGSTYHKRATGAPMSLYGSPRLLYLSNGSRHCDTSLPSPILVDKSRRAACLCTILAMLVALLTQHVIATTFNVGCDVPADCRTLVADQEWAKRSIHNKGRFVMPIFH